MDSLLLSSSGVTAELLFLKDVAGGSYRIESFGLDDVESATQLIADYDDLGIGLADASIVVIAARAATTRILTLDEPHFRAIRPLRGRSFTLLPADA